MFFSLLFRYEVEIYLNLYQDTRMFWLKQQWIVIFIFIVINYVIHPVDDLSWLIFLTPPQANFFVRKLFYLYFQQRFYSSGLVLGFSNCFVLRHNLSSWGILQHTSREETTPSALNGIWTLRRSLENETQWFQNWQP